MSKYKVGDKVRILSTVYECSNLTVGSVHEVVEESPGLAGLVETYEDGSNSCLFFYDHELEPYIDAEDNTAKIARLVRELNKALAESKDSIDINVYTWTDLRGVVNPVITATKTETIA